MSSKAAESSGLRRERSLLAREPRVLQPERSGLRRESNGLKTRLPDARRRPSRGQKGRVSQRMNPYLRVGCRQPSEVA